MIACVIVINLNITCRVTSWNIDGDIFITIERNRSIVLIETNDGVISYQLTFYKNNTSITLNGNKYITINVPAGYSASNIQVYDYNASDQRVLVDFISYNSAIRFQTVKGKFDIELGQAVTLNDITVVAPDKDTFALNSELDLAGMIVKANYSDGSVREIFDYEVGAVDMTTAGAKTVNITYGEKSASFNINVVEKAVSVAKVSQTPYKTVYELGETEISLDGLVVTAQYNDGDVATFKNGFTATVNGGMNTPGAKTVTVSGNGLEATYTITVSVARLSKIEITANSKTEYKVGEEFDYSSLTVIATYSDGTTATITDYRVMGFDSSKVGSLNLVINYNGKFTTLMIDIITNPDIGPVDPPIGSSSSEVPSSSSDLPSSSEVPASSSVAPASSSETPVSSSEAPITSSSAPTSSSENNGRKAKGCGGEIVSATMATMIVSALGVALLSIKRRKDR